MTTSDITWEKLAPELLQPLKTDGAAAEVISRPALTYLQDSLHRLRQNSLAMISLVVITLVTLAGIVGPWFFPQSAGGVAYENQQNPHDINQGPTRSAQLLVVDDFAPVPEERLDSNYDQQAALLSAGDLRAPSSVHIDGRNGRRRQSCLATGSRGIWIRTIPRHQN